MRPADRTHPFPLPPPMQIIPKRHFKQYAPAALSVLLSFCASIQPRSLVAQEVLDGLAAVVNNSPVTFSQVRELVSARARGQVMSRLSWGPGRVRGVRAASRGSRRAISGCGVKREDQTDPNRSHRRTDRPTVDPPIFQREGVPTPALLNRGQNSHSHQRGTQG